jgi:sugar/nucleoside kinase (ribokinase family)
MTSDRLDVLAIGNAIVDVIADAGDEFVATLGMAKGSMRLIDQVEATGLYERMGPAREASGGSAANTVAGLASLGVKAGFIGQLGDDQLGQIFTHDIRSLGVAFDTPPRSDVGATARCLIVVTPDAERTMSTFLGAAQMLEASAIDAQSIASAQIVYLEGYLWDPEAPRAAMYAAMDAAKAGGTKVAFTLSDSFVVDRHRDGLWQLFEQKRIDILFSNEAEIRALAQMDNAAEAAERVAELVPTVVVTCSEKGAFALSTGQRAEVAAEPIERLVDTTGAGDLFAAGFLAGEARGLGIETSLKLGAIAAAEVIQHYGARPEADLRALAGSLLV